MKYVLDTNNLDDVPSDFGRMGTFRSAIFPDLDNLAAELAGNF